MSGKITMAVCTGVDDSMTCRFNGDCYGEICIAPRICRKTEEELTDEDRAVIKNAAEVKS